jgi:hypothetical protein
MMLLMQEFGFSARVFRDGEVLCEEAFVIRRAEDRSIPVDLPGRGRGIKPNVVRGPTGIRFGGFIRTDFRAELERLALASRDDDVGRRDRGWRPRVTVAIDESGGPREHEDCYLERPINGYGAVEQIEFGLRHNEL